MKTLLYIEDNADNLKVLQMMIKRLRPMDDVLPARTAEEGIDIAIRMLPELILMDINLPGMDGYEALKILRSTSVTRHIPVIAVSAYAMQENILQGLAAGFDAYITKPVNMQMLAATISSCLPEVDMVQIGRG